MPPSLSELKVIPSFCFAFKIPDNPTTTRVQWPSQTGIFWVQIVQTQGCQGRQKNWKDLRITTMIRFCASFQSIIKNKNLFIFYFRLRNGLINIHNVNWFQLHLVALKIHYTYSWIHNPYFWILVLYVENSSQLKVRKSLKQIMYVVVTSPKKWTKNHENLT